MAIDRTARRRRAQARRRRRIAGTLAAVVVLAGAGIAAVAFSGGKSSPARTTAARAVRRHAVSLHPPGPIPGYLLIADRGNNRMLIVDSAKHIYWTYPGARTPQMPFRFDDDTFFGPQRDRIISNQEEQHTIQIISFPGRRVLWRYGHVNAKGSGAGYLNTPDDAYLLPNGLVTVADAYNCRVLFISRAHRIVRQYGTTGVCRHNPPSELGPINGATPLADGGTLVSEITGSWIDDIGANGRLRWTVQAPVSYPSDPQLLGPNRILVADYARPGHAIVMTRTGRVLWRYGPSSGPGELDHPSLATQIAPGLIAINDDYRHRVVLVSMHEHRIVWQYGHTGVPGRGPGYLNTPDGLDLLSTADAQASPVRRRLFAPPRRAAAAPRAGAAGLTVAPAPYRLPAAVERAVAVDTPGGIVIAGGLDAGGHSAAGVFRLDPASGKISQLGSVPQAFHDAAGALVGNRVLVFGGGSAQSSSAVQQFDLATRRGSVVGRLPVALSDLAAAQVGGSIFVIGGYDGRRPRAEIYRTQDGVRFSRVARLPTGLRYPAVAAVGTQIVIAGGVGPGGPSSAVYRFDTVSNRISLVGRLPRAVGHAAAVTVGSAVYVVGGTNAAGHTVSGVTRVDPIAGRVQPVAAGYAVADAAAVQLGSGALLVGGSRNGTAIRGVEQLRP